MSLFKKMTDWEFRCSRKNVFPHDWSNPGNVREEYDEMFKTKLERYARFLELKIKFRKYEELSSKEKDKIKKDAAPTIVTTNNRGGHNVTIGDCDFNCGNAPCGCQHDYDLYMELEAEFIDYGRLNKHLHDVLYAMYKGDK